MVEHHCQDADRLADRLLLQTLLVHVGDQARNRLGIDLRDGPLSELRQNPPKSDPVRLEGSRGDVDPGRLPAAGDVAENGGGLIVGKSMFRDAHRGELAEHPGLPRQRLALRRERTRVARHTLAAAESIHDSVTAPSAAARA